MISRAPWKYFSVRDYAPYLLANLERQGCFLRMGRLYDIAAPAQLRMHDYLVKGTRIHMLTRMKLCKMFAGEILLANLKRKLEEINLFSRQGSIYLTGHWFEIFVLFR